MAHVRALAVLAGGALGSLARAGTGEALPVRPGEWPWATFAVNLVGALVLAWLTTGEDGAFAAMWLYLLGSMVAGLAATGAGWLLGGALG